MLKKIFIKLSNYKTQPVFYKNPFKKYDIVMYDTIFPNPLSGFRMAEFSRYLNTFANCKIITSHKSYSVVNQDETDFKRDLTTFKINNKFIKNKISTIKFLNNANAKIFYCIFYNHIVTVYKQLNRLKIPYLFTLYPGGGFNIECDTVKENLKLICSSPQFRGVIVTQKITRDYLLLNNICNADKIHYIFGGIVPQNSINSPKRSGFNTKSSDLKICFCAAKYMDKGLDKRYDIFIDVAHKLSKKYLNIDFHVIGGFDENDIDVSSIYGRIHFHGYKKHLELQNIFKTMDVILSPNRPNILASGFFDGFPVGAVVEAALNGVIPIVTDVLNQNENFSSEELIIAFPTSESFITHIEQLISGGEFEKKSEKIRKRFIEIYSDGNQLNKRLKILNDSVLHFN